MAISLSNHEDRIKALEDKIGTGGDWEKGTHSTCNWAREKNSGLLIMWSKGTLSQWGNITLPYSYTSTSSFTIIVTQGNSADNWSPSDSCSTARVKTANSINVWSGERVKTNWMTIGY